MLRPFIPSRTYVLRCYSSCHPLKQPNDGHIYIVKEREFIKTNENVFKIGRSKNVVHRMPGYPKNSRIYSIVYAPNVNEVEKQLIDHFDQIFIKRTDIGNEYYECSENDIMKQCSILIHNLYHDEN